MATSPRRRWATQEDEAMNDTVTDNAQIKREFNSEGEADAYVSVLMEDTPAANSVIPTRSNATIAGVLAMLLGIPVSVFLALLGALIAGTFITFMGLMIIRLLMIVLQFLPFDAKSVLEVIAGLVGMAVGMGLGGIAAGALTSRLGHTGRNANPRVASGIALVAMAIVTFGMVAGNLGYNEQIPAFLRSWIGALLVIAVCVPGFITAFLHAKEGVEGRVYCAECNGIIAKTHDWYLSSPDTKVIRKRILERLLPYLPSQVVTVKPLSEEHGGTLEMHKCSGCKTPYLLLYRWFDGTYFQNGERHCYQKKRLVASSRLSNDVEKEVLSVDMQKPVDKPESTESPKDEVTTPSDTSNNIASDECPKGHGPLKLWQGKARCWTCGWPDKK